MDGKLQEQTAPAGLPVGPFLGWDGSENRCPSSRFLRFGIQCLTLREFLILVEELP
jgi:hypothetical protein